MKDLIELIKLLQNFNPSVRVIIFISIFTLIIVILKIYDEFKCRKYYDDMKNEKNKEIERLADDNRRYRDIYLKGFGLEQEEINELSAKKIQGEL